MSEPMVVAETSLREIVARALWRAQFRLREWDHAKPYLKKVVYARADDAIKRAGVENIDVPVKAGFGKLETRKGR